MSFGGVRVEWPSFLWPGTGGLRSGTGDEEEEEGGIILGEDEERILGGSFMGFFR